MIEWIGEENMDLLTIEALWKSYAPSRQEKLDVLKGLSLRVEPGEMVAVMGASGSGKTTLVNLISSVDLPDRGEIRIGGQRLSELDKTGRALLRRRVLGMVFQDFNLIESLSVRENILLPMILDERPAEEQEQRLLALVKPLGIEDIVNRGITEISGGQKQRAAICRALINGPAFLLADEPTGNLDPRSTREVMRCFEKIHAETGTGVLMVTHDTFAASCCGRAVFLADGVIGADIRRAGTRAHFLDAITETLAFLGGGQDDLL